MTNSNKRIYVDIHVLQTVPPSCVNRDDTGSPKTAKYGGTTRARVSSQCWKHAVRTYFRSNLDDSQLAMRTQKSDEIIAKCLMQDYGYDAETASKTAIDALLKLKIKSSADGKKDALFFISNAQAKAIAEVLKASSEDCEEKAYISSLRSAILEAPGVEIALFGRMVAGDTSLNYDVCCQVAHAISTHKVSNEFDYFTAVDDIRATDEDSTDNGAGHIGTTEFNSSTLYRYATVAVHDLEEELGDITAETVKQFIKAFAMSMPTGKVNSYANGTVPDAILVTIRDDQPVNFVGAFESAVNAKDGYVKASEAALEDYAADCYESFVSKPCDAFVTGGLSDKVGKKESFDNLLADVEAVLSNKLADMKI